MIELHGWVTIRETYEARFDEEDNIDVVVNKISEEIERLLFFKPQLKAQNGTNYLEFSLFSNRENSQIQEAFKLYKRIGELASGSYGVMYLYDDEKAGKENQFQVFSLARGLIRESDDIYLSPIVPVIEDEEFFTHM